MGSTVPMPELSFGVSGFLKPKGWRWDSPTPRRSVGAVSPCASYAFRARAVLLRIVYAFDPQRQAVLILGGDKTGDSRFYRWAIPKAEAIWERYLQELR